MNLNLAVAIPLLVALLAGAAVPFQAGANAALGRLLGHPLWATLISLAVSVLLGRLQRFVRTGFQRLPTEHLDASVQQLLR